MRLRTKDVFRDMFSSGFLSSEFRQPVNCIIADGILGFTCDVANEVGIPIFYVRTVSSCCLWVFFCLPHLIESGEIPFKGDDLDTLIKSVPGTETFLRRRDLPAFCRSGDLQDQNVQFYKTERQENSRANGLILNSFEELEGPILNQIRIVCPNIYTIGPLHAHLKSKLSKQTSPPAATSSSSLWKEDRSCIEWLDAQQPRSVLYVSFGSIAQLGNDQFLEFWHGLVNSGVKFLWVIRPDSIDGKDSRSEVPLELSEGTKQRGYIVEWAPQEEVLAHKAIGGFLTHNGWNSTLESIFEGVPMICWPNFLDQQVNSRFVSEVWRLGLDMKDSCERGVVERMVRDLMVVRKDEFLKRAQEMRERGRRCLEKGGSSYDSLERLIRDIEDSVNFSPSKALASSP